MPLCFEITRDIISSLPKSDPGIVDYSSNPIFLSGRAVTPDYIIQSGRDFFNEILILKAHVFTGLRRMKTSFKRLSNLCPRLITSY